MVKVYSVSLLILDLNFSTPSGIPFLDINSTLCPLSVAYQKTVSPELILTISWLKTMLRFSSLFNISTVMSSAKSPFEKIRLNKIINKYLMQSPNKSKLF